MSISILFNDSWDPRVASADLQQWVITRMDRDWESLAVFAKIKIGARRMHALESDTSDGLAASNSVTDGTMVYVFVEKIT